MPIRNIPRIGIRFYHYKSDFHSQYIKLLLHEDYHKLPDY